MRKTTGVALGVAGLVLAGVAAVMGGLVTLPSNEESGRPPCTQLPDRPSVEAALAAHQPLVNRLRSVGPGVTVAVATPCDTAPDRAIVSITYSKRSHRAAIDSVLQQEDGFGVPAQLQQR